MNVQAQDRPPPVDHLLLDRHRHGASAWTATSREDRSCLVNCPPGASSRPDTGPHLNYPPPHTGRKRLTDGDEAYGHPFSLISRIRGGPIGPSPPWHAADADPRGEQDRSLSPVLTDER
jgi:hypothetical protein